MTTRKKGEPDMGKRKALPEGPRSHERACPGTRATRSARSCGRPARATPTPRGRPRRTAPTRSTWSSSPRRDGCPTCFPSATGGWRSRPSRSTGARPSPWPPTSSGTPVSGIRVQACGDAHLCNFGGFATPERKIIFSINDLDETLPAPWEWDVKRLAPSFVVACRDNGLSEAVAKEAVLTCVRTYRESMAEFSEMKTLELWYRIDDGRGADRGPASRLPEADRQAHREGAGEEPRRGALPEARGAPGGRSRHQGPAPDDLPHGGAPPGRGAEVLPGRLRRLPRHASALLPGPAGPLRAEGRRRQGGRRRQRRDRSAWSSS